MNGPFRILLFAAAIAGAAFVGYSIADIHHEATPRPSGNATVTCYTANVNGTAHALCPDTVMFGSGALHINVKPCSEYEFANDEPHPCDGLGDEVGETESKNE